jgi:hypothetical protein
MGFAGEQPLLQIQDRGGSGTVPCLSTREAASIAPSTTSSPGLWVGDVPVAQGLDAAAVCGLWQRDRGARARGGIGKRCSMNSWKLGPNIGVKSGHQPKSSAQILVSCDRRDKRPRSVADAACAAVEDSSRNGR